MHRVDEETELRPADVSDRGQRGGEVAYGEPRTELDGHHHLARPRHLGQRTELVEGPAEVGLQAHGVDPPDAELVHDVEVGRAVADVDFLAHDHSLAERDRARSVSPIRERSRWRAAKATRRYSRYLWCSPGCSGATPRYRSPGPRAPRWHAWPTPRLARCAPASRRRCERKARMISRSRDGSWRWRPTWCLASTR